jgi:hypothetical protein
LLSAAIGLASWLLVASVLATKFADWRLAPGQKRDPQVWHALVRKHDSRLRRAPSFSTAPSPSSRASIRVAAIDTQQP